MIGSLFPLLRPATEPTPPHLLNCLQPYPLLYDFAQHNLVTAEVNSFAYKFILSYTLSTHMWTLVRKQLEMESRRALPHLFKALAGSIPKLNADLQIHDDPHTDWSLRWQSNAYERGLFDSIPAFSPKAQHRPKKAPPKSTITSKDETTDNGPLDPAATP